MMWQDGIALAFVGGLSVFTLSCSNAESASPLAWSNRGIFVFSSVVLDFQQPVEAFGPLQHGLTNCSTEKYYCASADIVRIALPRKCDDIREIHVGDVWSVGEVETKVLAEKAEPAATQGVHPYGSGKVFFLGDARHPHVVYEYDKDVGVRAFYYDMEGVIDFVSIARTKDPYQYLRENHLSDDLYHFSLITFDQFGRCMEAWEIKAGN